MYSINEIPISAFSLTPGRAPGSNIAISGCWNMPARIGKTYQVWEESNEIEPYLRQDEMFFGGRDLSLLCWADANSRADYIDTIQRIQDELDSLQNGMFTLSCQWGVFHVQAVAVSPAEYVGSGYGNIQLKFREPVVDLSGDLPDNMSGGVGIDNYSFSDLGLTKVMTRNQADRPASRTLISEAYGIERIGAVRREAREFSLEFFIDVSTYTQFVSIISGFSYLLSRPGARTLRLDDNTTREVFVKDGFSVTEVRQFTNRFVGFLTVKFMEIRMLENWNLLTDNVGEILIDSHGQSLTEILKRF